MTRYSSPGKARRGRAPFTHRCSCRRPLGSWLATEPTWKRIGHRPGRSRVLIPISVSVGPARSLAWAGWTETAAWAFASLTVVGVLLALALLIASSIG